MKKILVSVMVLVSVATYALNPNDDYSVLHKLNNQEVISSLAGFINADQEQTSFLKNVFQITDNELTTAEKTQNEKLAESVLNYNLYNSKCILSEDQYKKYLMFINYYLRNDNLLSLSNK